MFCVKTGYIQIRANTEPVLLSLTVSLIHPRVFSIICILYVILKYYNRKCPRACQMHSELPLDTFCMKDSVDSTSEEHT